MKPVFGPEIDDALASLTGELEGLSPEIGALIAEARAGGASETDLMARVMQIVAQDPELARKVEAVASTVLAPLRGGLPAPASRPGADIVVPPPGGVGLPRLQPLYEAALQERLQFDGDAPELRFGPMPEGVTPAVPVATEARDPAAIGWMLEDAAEQVAAEARRIEAGREDEVRALVGGRTEESLALQDSSMLALSDRNTLPDPTGYERGQVPARREVDAPDGWALAALTPEQRGQLAWKFLSTTQGRRSATSVIREILLVKLRSDGIGVVLGAEEPGRVDPSTIVAHAEWTVDLGGPNSTQSSFAFVDMAASVLLRKLEGGLPFAGEGTAGVALEVVSVNAVDVRRVGWAARLVRVAS